MFETLSNEKLAILTEISKGQNVFITGSAGTGKSYLLKIIKNKFQNSGLHVTASTGIAAVNIGGTTLHSWAGIGIGNAPAEKIIEYINTGKATFLRRKLKKARILAIDEISMISAEIFDLLDKVLKDIRANNSAFGGLQIIVLGDFLQLPPIKDNISIEQKFCFESEAWKKANFSTFYLEKIYRQNDQYFCDLLLRMRLAALNEQDIEILNSRIIKKTDNEIKPTIIVTHNKQVELINKRELEKLPYEKMFFQIQKKGDDKNISFLTKNCLAAETLILKQNAQVMMLKNTYYKENIINGSLGIVYGFTEKGFPIIKFSCGTIKEIQPEEWNVEIYDEHTQKMIVKASIKQIPLILSWAITVHKSQGMTLDEIECDLGSAFEEGQIYVAISRVKSLKGLYLKNFNSKSIKANNKVIEFYKNMNK